jgi:hypothetical protein
VASKKIKPESPWGGFMDIEEIKFGESSHHYLHFYHKGEGVYSGMRRSAHLLDKEKVREMIKYLKEVVKYID